MFDFLIVGAGFAGSVLAERLANEADRSVLLIDSRDHVGGNAYDFFDDSGVLVHKYGPHIFHTNSERVLDYLSMFTAWRPYEHRVLSSVDGKLLPIPINLDTINKLYGLQLTSNELISFFAERAVPLATIKTSEDVVVSQIGWELYEKFFHGYTVKQWGLDPSELDATVTGRIPIRINQDDRYFSDKHQAMPAHGYSALFKSMLEHPNITVQLNTDYSELAKSCERRHTIFTGPIDLYFDYCLGVLPYRSIDFKFETIDREFCQPVATINHPSDEAFTRVTEFKHITGQTHRKTTLCYEYPTADGTPYYPIPRASNTSLYLKYQRLASTLTDTTFVGRLGTYKYYNMDQVVAQALSTYDRISATLPGGRSSGRVPAR